MIQLDGIRAFAVGGVILEHWASGFPRSLRNSVQALDLGGLGVECFFVLSGFLITLILLNAKDQNRSFRTELGHFYLRRVLRIFPAYYAALFVTSILFDDMRHVVGWHAFYLSNLYPLWYGAWPPIGGHFWSLSVEEQFYLFWPLIVLVLPMKKVMLVAIAGCILAPVSRLMIWHIAGNPASVTVTTTALDLLCFGAFLACVKHKIGLPDDSLLTRRLQIAGLISLSLYAVLYFGFKHSLLNLVFGRTLTAIVFGALIATAANGFKGPIRLILENSFIVWLGVISYGLYIFHPFIPNVYILILNSLGLGTETFGIYYIRYPLLTILLFAVTTSSYYLLERPIQRLRKYFL